MGQVVLRADDIARAAMDFDRADELLIGLGEKALYSKGEWNRGVSATTLWSVACSSSTAQRGTAPL